MLLLDKEYIFFNSSFFFKQINQTLPMKQAIILIIFFSTNKDMYSQIQKYYFGLEFGISKEFINVNSNDRNYFDCRRKCWSDSDEFFKRNGTINLSFGIILNKNLNVELGVTRMFLHRTAQYSTIDLIGPSGSLSTSGYFSSRPQLKWNLSFGKQIYLGADIFYIPQIQLAYMYVKNETDTIYYYEENYELFKYNEYEKNLSTNQVFIGIKNKFETHISKNWKIHASLSYNQGLGSNYYIKQEIQLLKDPKTTFYGDKSSRLSHAFVSIGIDFIISKKVQ
jgi:hypothetical protein